MLDIQHLRNDTPACDHIAHFNNAGSALSPQSVTDAVIEHLRKEQDIGGYEAAAQAVDAAQKFYTSMAKLLNCEAGEIAFVENATRAWELALYSIPFQPGDEIITFESEYASNYMGLLHLARQKELRLTIAPFNDNGQVDLSELETLVSNSTRLIALTHIASQRGDIQPATEVGKIAQRYGIYYLLDGCQSVGQCEVNVAEIGCDFLAGTGRKYLRGPRGTGFLYVSQKRLPKLQPVFVDLHSGHWLSREQFTWHEGAQRFETFERHVAGMIGLGVAADYAASLGMAEIQKRIRELATRLRERLSALPDISVHERSGNYSGIVTFSKQGESAESIKQRLADQKINTSVSKRSNARLDLDQENLDSVVRVSVHYYNTEKEMDRLIEELR